MSDSFSTAQLFHWKLVKRWAPLKLKNSLIKCSSCLSHFPHFPADFQKRMTKFFKITDLGHFHLLLERLSQKKSGDKINLYSVKKNFKLKWKLNLNGNKHKGMFPNKWMTSQTTWNFCLGNANTKSDRQIRHGNILHFQSEKIREPLQALWVSMAEI